MKKIVELEIKKGSDGHWLNFKDSKGRHASININIENVFCNEGIIDPCIRQWAEDQFKD